MTAAEIGSVVALAAKIIGAWALVGLIRPKLFFGASSRRTVGRGFVGALVLFAIGMAIIGTDGNKKTAAASAPAPQPPPDQERFIASVAKAELAYFAAETDMARGGTRAERRAAICAVLKSPVVQNWIGTVTDATSTHDGRGVLTLRIAHGIELGTTKNSISNVEFDTLIVPGSSVFKSAAELTEGDTVQFSGLFSEDDQDCVREVSDTLRGSMTDPEFLFRFTAVKKL
jgi:hypothetical protein